jgi:hypothetical protein
MDQMSPQGVPAAVVFIVCCFLFVGVVILADYLIDRRMGEAYTITFGFRWLARHVPMITHAAIFLLGLLLGWLFSHFLSTPTIFWP